MVMRMRAKSGERGAAVVSTAKLRSPLVAKKKSPPLGFADHMLSLRCSAVRQAGLQ